MDPVSVIGLGASIIGITDVVTRTLSALRQLQQRWKTADVTVGLLVSQLTTLKAALNQISDWVNQRLEGAIQHHQLVMDLESSMQSCNLLVSLMDSYISELNFDEKNSLVFESRAKAVLQAGQVKECVSHLNNQATALNLLLTALNCQKLSEQRDLLESDQSRRIFDQVKDDSSSLIVLKDSGSFSSSWATSTVRSSVLNQAFDFDGEIMKSKVYQSQMRSLLKRIVQKRKDVLQEPKAPQEPKAAHILQRHTTTHIVKQIINLEKNVFKSRPLSTLIDPHIEHSLINLTLVDEFDLKTHLLSPKEGIPVKYVRPYWTFSGEESKIHRSDTKFRVVNHISYGKEFFDMVLGADYCRKIREDFTDVLGPQISSATQTNYY